MMKPAECQQLALLTRISVVIICLNEEAFLQPTILSAKSDKAAEVLVVDGGSSDGSVKLARRLGARVLQIKAASRAEALNYGARASTGDALIFLHADTQLPSGYRSWVLECIADPRVLVGAFGFRMSDRSEARGPWARVSLGLIDLGARVRSRFLGLPYGDQGLFMRREAFESLGGFPSLPFMEDLELVLQARRKGKIRVVELDAFTSARRWLVNGPWKVTILNQVVLVGRSVGVPLPTLGRMYKALKGSRKQ